MMRRDETHFGSGYHSHGIGPDAVVLQPAIDPHPCVAVFRMAGCDLERGRIVGGGAHYLPGDLYRPAPIDRRRQDTQAYIGATRST